MFNKLDFVRDFGAAYVVVVWVVFGTLVVVVVGARVGIDVVLGFWFGNVERVGLWMLVEYFIDIVIWDVLFIWVELDVLVGAFDDEVVWVKGVFDFVEELRWL